MTQVTHWFTLQTYVRFTTDITHGCPTFTGHLVTAFLLHKLGFTSVTDSNLCHGHLLLTEKIKILYRYMYIVCTQNNWAFSFLFPLVFTLNTLNDLLYEMINNHGTQSKTQSYNLILRLTSSFFSISSHLFPKCSFQSSLQCRQVS